MTEAALEYQATKIPRIKLVLIHQGVDLQRFMPSQETRKRTSREPNVLFYTRLHITKEGTLWRVLEELLGSAMRVTILGDGDAFWEISDRFGQRLTLINHIPCHSIHNFLPHFDVVISSGRGVMEALASGLPALCAGFDYGGPVLPTNIRRHLEVNITGFGMGADVAAIRDDIKTVLSLEQRTCRLMAEEHCSVETFLDKLAIRATASQTNNSPLAEVEG